MKYELNNEFGDPMIKKTGREMDLTIKVCEGFCPYYKPDKDEGLACRGFLVIQRLLERNKEILFSDPGKGLTEDIKDMLVRNMCTDCSFYEDDCDFADHKDGALPCGGFILLGNLLTEGIIRSLDILSCLR